MMINFEVSSQGVTLTDPHKRTFSKKSFDVKFITYVARVRYVYKKVPKLTITCFVFMLETILLLLFVRVENLTVMSSWRER